MESDTGREAVTEDGQRVTEDGTYYAVVAKPYKEKSANGPLEYAVMRRVLTGARKRGGVVEFDIRGGGTHAAPLCMGKALGVYATDAVWDGIRMPQRVW